MWKHRCSSMQCLASRPFMTGSKARCGLLETTWNNPRNLPSSQTAKSAKSSVVAATLRSHRRPGLRQLRSEPFCSLVLQALTLICRHERLPEPSSIKLCWARIVVRGLHSMKWKEMHNVGTYTVDIHTHTCACGWEYMQINYINICTKCNVNLNQN